MFCTTSVRHLVDSSSHWQPWFPLSTSTTHGSSFKGTPFGSNLLSLKAGPLVNNSAWEIDWEMNGRHHACLHECLHIDSIDLDFYLFIFEHMDLQHIARYRYRYWCLFHYDIDWAGIWWQFQWWNIVGCPPAARHDPFREAQELLQVGFAAGNFRWY